MRATHDLTSVQADGGSFEVLIEFYGRNAAAALLCAIVEYYVR
jgi:hypothetical protein